MSTALELCAGGGGQALGFEAAGFEHVALIDNDPHACATLRLNRPYWNVIEANLRRFRADYWRGVDVIGAGLPCPPYSVAGKQLGADDERDLFPAFLEVVGAVRPKAVLVENVRGLMQPRFAQYREEIETKLTVMGFAVHWTMLDAYDFGASQRRVRVFLVGEQSGNFSWPATNGGGSTVGETLRDLMAEGGWEQADRWAERADKPAPTLVGGSRKHGGPDLGPTRARAAWAALGVDGLGVANESPSPGFNGMPRLTLPMLARLQSFPESWRFSGTKTQRWRQIGNALTVNLSMAVAKSLRKCLN